MRVPSFLLTQPFQSTLPARGATLQRQHIAAGIPHFNPRSPHGERPCSARRCGLLRPISIHAPRTGSDGICIVFSFRQYGRISIHAPRTGSDERENTTWEDEDISIHAPRTGSDSRRRQNEKHDREISIHAPRTGSDLGARRHGRRQNYFNPRSPHGERHWDTGGDVCPAVISIHAPRTGSDTRRRSQRARTNHFNPRSPHGERPGSASAWAQTAQFQSTLPARGATREPWSEP